MPLNDFDLEWKRLLRTVVLPPIGLGNAILAPWIIWAIWTARNQKLFQNRTFSAQETVTKAICDAKEWATAQVPVKTCEQRRKIQPNRSTTEITCKSDAAWRKDLQAARAAMEQAVALQMRRVVFESDSLQLVTAIADGSSFSDLHGILSDIYLLSISFDFVSFSFCRRETLCFEDSAAKNSLSNFVLTQTIEPVLV
ncbi:hypothetical protein F2Q68_00012728 [Brassica cretica]|uniref:RNase H type-1 domain-containing protein n=1 Tax=Brassica cretica TaxID=69181 RepID=A0A8S9HTR5_BRACR|nr:hypothetical protein F2Q68_00012728 [Brassica cretica]